jgi:hypothetical protein
MTSNQGRRLIAALFAAIDGRYVVSVNEKLLALCGWFFEYIYEPVYQDDPWLLYDKNLHRFVAMYAWIWMNDTESGAKPMIEQFQKYMRSRDPVDAPFLFDRPRPPLTGDGMEHPFESVLRFAYGYRDIIIAGNARLDTELPDQGRWTLDLSTSTLWSHLNYWGRTGRLLRVNCDVSKPLQANILNFTGDDSDPGIHRARMKRSSEKLGWKLAQPIAFVDSLEHPTVQLADIIAGTVVSAFSNGWPAGCEAIGESIARHAHPHSIMPDIDVVNPKNKPAMVNAFILYDMAKRAKRHGDPFEGLAAMYHAAEVGWARGDFNRLTNAGGGSAKP